MSNKLLFTPTTLGRLKLKNRVVMAPMTRSRSLENNAPNALVAEYYGQRANAGLIITEGTSPAPEGTGYPRIPGLWSKEQIAAWLLVTDTVHANDGHIFVQLMHTGRVGHPLNLPDGAEVLAPSAVACSGEMYTDAKGMQPYPVPRAMTGDEVLKASAAYVKAAKNALAAGFDGVEIHGANGYLIDQFLSPQTNQRDDQWGGSIAKRCAFALAVSEAVADAIGGEKVGIRLSPYGANADMKPYDEIDATYRYLVGKLVDTGIQYIHIVDHSAMGAPKVPETLKNEMRALWPRDYIVSGGFDKDSAEQALQDKRGDLVAFGRPYIANPDLLQRFEGDVPLADADFSTFYTPGAKGYTDYPASQ